MRSAMEPTHLYRLLWSISSWQVYIPETLHVSFHPVHISRENVETIKEYTRKIAEEMHVQGLMNMQYAIENGKVYVLGGEPESIPYRTACVKGL